jgi:hypothetical protein
MRYFTRELWLSAQETGKAEQYGQDWQRATDNYNAQLKALQPRLSQDAYNFFVAADVHDGELLELVVENGGRSDVLAKRPRPRKTSRKYPVRAKLTVLDANDTLVWRLSYGSVRRVVFDFPTGDPLFYHEGDGWGDWGYHELTEAGNGFLRHEVLFATGAILLFEFKEIAVEDVPRSSVGNKETVPERPPS